MDKDVFPYLLLIIICYYRCNYLEPIKFELGENKYLDEKCHLEFAGRKQGVLEWHARQKIAVGAARGLRYLHEECRVGCIVHRDMRPNNILLTHDFEALVHLMLLDFQYIHLVISFVLRR